MTKRTIIVLTFGVFIALAAQACGAASDQGTGAGAGVAGAASPSRDDGMVASAVKIANEIQARPDDAAAILERHGLSRDEFESMMYEIAADPELSRAYNEAMGR